MFIEIWPEPIETSDIERAISLIAAVCSSTAEAIECWISLICVIVEVISWIAAIASAVSDVIVWIFCVMSVVAVAVARARSLTSLATTAKPRHWVPARAASIVAFSARRFVR